MQCIDSAGREPGLVNLSAVFKPERFLLGRHGDLYREQGALNCWMGSEVTNQLTDALGRKKYAVQSNCTWHAAAEHQRLVLSLIWNSTRTEMQRHHENLQALQECHGFVEPENPSDARHMFVRQTCYNSTSAWSTVPSSPWSPVATCSVVLLFWATLILLYIVHELDKPSDFWTTALNIRMHLLIPCLAKAMFRPANNSTDCLHGLLSMWFSLEQSQGGFRGRNERLTAVWERFFICSNGHKYWLLIAVVSMGSRYNETGLLLYTIKNYLIN